MANARGAIFLLALVVCTAMVDARFLTPYEQAIGQWDVSLKCADTEVPSMLFPSGDGAAFSQKRVQCHLDIFSNGTFCMNAPNEKDPMPVRGQWKLQPNPYCITDRQYDQLVLESYPRVQKRITAKHDKEEVLQRVGIRLQCRLWGRYGSDPIRKLLGYRRGRCMARMTHGTLLWNVVESHLGDLPRWKARRVCATFEARPIQDESSSQHDDDPDDDY
jgi:hypothetical protein